MTVFRLIKDSRAGLAACCLLLMAFATTTANASALEAFYGHYIGEVALYDSSGAAGYDEKNRHTSVRIDKDGTGFRIDWKTVIAKANGKTKTVSYSIHFQKTEHEGTYSSAMRKNMFGKWIPLNPLEGEPYVWARLDGEILSVYALIIREDGGYEMQQYDRTLRQDGDLDLVFTRVRDGMPLKTIRGILKKQ